MAARKKRKTPTKKAASKGGKRAAKKGSSAKPKFGSAAWFAKYPKAKKLAKRKKK